ncbi:MAG: membrane protein insertase YidC [Caldimicrobium sp.]
MDNRVFLAIILSIGVLILSQYIYMKYFSPTPPTHNQTLTDIPKENKNEHIEASQGFIAKPLAIDTKEQTYSIKTNYYNAQITNLGVRFKAFKLLNYSQDLKKKDPVDLVSAKKDGLPLEIYLAQSPQLALLPFESNNPTDNIITSNHTLSFKGKAGPIEIEKKYTFKNNSYFIDLDVKIKNLGNETLKDRLLVRGVFGPFSKGNGYVFKGPFYYTNHLNEVNLKDSLVEYAGPLKFLGYMDVYFLVSIIPLENSTFRSTFRNISEEIKEFILWTEEITIAPNSEKGFHFKLYMGPKKSEELAKEFPLLSKALYFGMFDFVAKPLLYLLKFLNNFVHNYGIAIIIVTLLIRILFYPLNHVSYKSMKKMQELQPIFQRLKEKYKDDPQTLQKEIMQLYRTHKINPFSGCLPILIQIPVFIAFYKVLLMAIELRHAPFFLWINDLSSPERLYLGTFEIPWLGGIPVLTILMGISMYIQQKLTPTSMDPTQEKIMLILPIFFTILFINFPSGLVLYWLMNNILSILQQLITLKLSKK